jgi:hypothetical protein
MNHFIKLPDGTIINVRHVERVSRVDSGGEVPSHRTIIDMGYDSHYVNEPKDGPVFAYFDSIAQVIPSIDTP